jgi:universal stress protein E
MINLMTVQRILVPTDFSPHSETALKQAIWVARQSGAKITLAHVLPDIRKALMLASPGARFDAFVGSGEQFQQEIREDSDARMRAAIAKMNAPELDIHFETLLGDPWVAIIHAVQQENHDLVIVGTHGQSTWEQFFVGSTAHRLIRHCPSPVWVVKGERSGAPKLVLASSDFSEASRMAAILGCQIAQQAGSEFHMLHVIDDKDVPTGAIERLNPGGALRGAINDVAADHLAEAVKGLGNAAGHIHSHLSWGIPAQEIIRLIEHLDIDLLVLGTVGRSGINGVLLGNTAEKVLNHCRCSVLACKPDSFVSSVPPPFWPLHPKANPDM